jgi:opacity protein-like surface antigen
MKNRSLHRMLSAIMIGLLVVLAVSSAPPALASTGDTLELTVVPAAVLLGTAAAGYLYYKNRYNQPADAKGSLGYRGPGEFFVGGFLGGAFVADTQWDYRAGPWSTKAHNMQIDPGITGGIKLGYFLDSFPYFGIEAEGSIGRHYQPSQTVSLNPVPGRVVGNYGQINGQSMLAWTMAFHFLGRYGFLPSREVPFGHLQPYVGIGPGLVMLYAEADSAKNFSLEVEAGVRYMFNRNLGAFLEYKLSQQWQVELESQNLRFSNAVMPASTAVFDFTRNQIVVGLAYHF